jgi:drug/metabolite transporter (DMT)-like permease
MQALNNFLSKVAVEIINPIILLLATLAFIAFLWGVVEFVYNAADEERRKEGREAIMWGLIGLVIIFGVYGILNLFTGFANLPAVTPISR